MVFSLRTKLFFILILVTVNVSAETIAQCSGPKGYSYYPFEGLVSKEKSGWVIDSITDGKFTLTRDESGKFDLIYIDALGKIRSTTDDGGTIRLFARDQNSFGILIFYTGTIETYNFFKLTSGELEFVETTSRVGSPSIVKKASLMRGECSFLKFEL